MWPIRQGVIFMAQRLQTSDDGPLSGAFSTYVCTIFGSVKTISNKEKRLFSATVARSAEEALNEQGLLHSVYSSN